MKVSEFTGSEAEWTAFSAANGGGALHSWQWGELRRDTNWTVRRFQVEDGNQLQIIAMVMQRPLPARYCFFYSPEGPIVRGADWADKQNQKAFTALNNHLKKLSKSEKALFYKIDPHIARKDFPTAFIQSLGFIDSVEDVQAPFIVHVDLTASEEEMLARMKQSGRRHIRQAEKRGVTITLGTSEQDLDTFYALHEKMAHRQGVTYRQKAYFDLIRKNFMVNSDHATFVTGHFEGKPVASILVTFMGDESIYLYGGTDVNEGNTYAMYLAQWAGMKEAKRRGCTFYNMTGISPTDDPADRWYGLRQFKLKFGGEIVELLSAWDYPYKKLRYHAFMQADRVRRKMAKRSGL